MRACDPTEEDICKLRLIAHWAVCPKCGKVHLDEEDDKKCLER
jgi:hypothetical protein